jgi:hypothetical protein
MTAYPFCLVIEAGGSKIYDGPTGLLNEFGASSGVNGAG